MKTLRLRSSVVSRVTKPVVKQRVVELYIKAMEWRSITSDPTGPDHSLVLKLGWSLASRIVHGNPNAAEAVSNMIGRLL